MATKTKEAFTAKEKQMVSALDSINQSTDAELKKLARDPNFVDNAIKAIQVNLYEAQGALAKTISAQDMETFETKAGRVLGRYESWKADQYKSEGSLLDAVLEERFQKSKEFSPVEKDIVKSYSDSVRLSKMEYMMSAWVAAIPKIVEELRKEDFGKP